MDLTAARAEFEFDAVKKNTRVAYALWCLTGIFGGHRFYLGDTARSIAMLFTLGGLGVWTLLDVFFIARRVHTVNSSRRAAIMARHGLVEGTSQWTVNRRGCTTNGPTASTSAVSGTP
ncbi:TM2 domain-containing protein [Actinoplanes sp. CA-131856]